MSGTTVLLRGGRIAAEDSPDLVDGDVLVEGGKISRIAAGLEVPEQAKVIECSGQIVMPGICDLHVHAREPGQEQKETIQSCSEAAVNGGVTAMLLMSNTLPAIDSGGLVQSVLDIAEEKSKIPVWQAGCITKGRAGEDLAGIAGMAKKCVPVLSDGSIPIRNPQVLRRAMDYAKAFDLVLAMHCEVEEMMGAGAGAMNEGRVSYQLGLPGIPAISEEICLDRDIRIAQYTGARVHIQHVSTARGMETVRRYKEAGVRVTCEVAPHHLLFHEGDIGNYDTHYKVNPPLRTEEDNVALLQGLIDGVFDVIATDHAPHTQFEKNNDFVSAPFGITGLETALVSLFDRFVSRGELGWDVLVRRYSAEPRRLVGSEAVPVVEGGVADLIVFDPEAETTFSKQFMKSKSNNTPFLGRTLKGQVRVVLRGSEILLER